MPYFLSSKALVVGQRLTVGGGEAAHLLGSRRLRRGEAFWMQDASGRRCRVLLLAEQGGEALIEVLAEAPVPAPPTLRLHLLQAVLKDKAAEWIVQKATELGAATLSFFPAAHSPPSRPDKTLIRMKKIAWEACKQCERQFPPALNFLPDFSAALRQEAEASISWLLHPAAEASLPGGSAKASCARVLVGPEGGFAPPELSEACQVGFVPIRLGPNILRAETAALAACALLLTR